MTEWQPIDTAPKDGTEVLLYAPGRLTYGAWSKPSDTPRIVYREGFAPEPEWDEFEPYWSSYDGGFTNENPPTHWMQKPSPPGEYVPTLEDAYAEGRKDEREEMVKLLSEEAASILRTGQVCLDGRYEWMARGILAAVDALQGIDSATGKLVTAKAMAEMLAG